MTASRIKGLYAVTPDLADTADLHNRVAACLQGGASLIQYRNKTATAELRKEQALDLLSLCH
ncbi:MAG TPA: thiamine phosphate synthase, partial [Methylophilaceae bacterium]|nr:thiamine phosphate synthase [Methylophilaceae bacterium]